MFRSQRFIRQLSLVLVAATMWGGSAFGQTVEEDETEVLESAAKPPTDRANPSEVAELIVKKTNEFRKKHGLEETEVNRHLKEAAQYFAQYMARTDQYGHRADGQRPSERAKKHGYDLCIVAENIAYQYSSAGFDAAELASRFVEGWKDSPHHRKNMLDPDVRDIGVALARSEDTGHWYAVQMFGRSQSAAIKFSVENRTSSTVHYTIKERLFELPPRYTRTHVRCRPAEVDFEFRKGSGITAEDGGHYTIVETGGKLELQGINASP